MTYNSDFTQVANDLVVTLEYTLKVDDEIIDSSKEGGPVRFVQGSGEIVLGLERQLDGLALGESRNIIVSAEEGYGKFDEGRVVAIDRNEFPENIPVELGIQLRLKDGDGNPLSARIYEITDDFVKLDFNHILAGKELQFDVKVIDLRAVTMEELDPGHDQ
jgi:FKBP-type peptidyl-prolyl cis-trans isomerase SlyD